MTWKTKMYCDKDGNLCFCYLFQPLIVDRKLEVSSEGQDWKLTRLFATSPE